MHGNYCKEWQSARVNFILSKYPKEFFQGKTVLELAPFNGHIGAEFDKLGASVTYIEGRIENVEYIQKTFPHIPVIHADLDTPTWEWGDFDIILNFGVLYHLEHYHKEFLTNSILHSKLLFLESVIYDSSENELFFRNEQGLDQSLTNRAGNPSTSYVESILDSYEVRYTKYTSSELNGGGHTYDWVDSNSKTLHPFHRRFWIVGD